MRSSPDREQGFDLSPLKAQPDHHHMPAEQKIALAAIIAAGALCVPDEAKAQTVLTPAPLVQPHDPKTYYIGAEPVQVAMVAGFVAGFNVVQNKPVTFHITGPAKIELRAYPWVYSDLKKRANATEQFKVDVDGTPMFTPAAVVDQKAKTVAETESCLRGGTPVDLKECGKGDAGKDDSKIGLLGKYFSIPLALGEGTHEVTLTSLSGGVIIQLVGAAQTEKPPVVSAPELKLPEGFDYEFPPEIKTGCRIESTENGNFEFKFIPPFASAANLSALLTEKAEIKPELGASTKVGAILSTADGNGNIKYRLDPIEPNKDYTCTLTRIAPAAGSTPGAVCADTLEATYDGNTTIKIETNPSRTENCMVNTFAGRDGKPVNVISCEIAKKVLAAQEARACAYRARADQRTGSTAGNRRYLLRKY